MKKFTKLSFFLSLLLASFNLLAQPLSGGYTIDANTATGGTNYQSFSDAAADLNQFGVSGAVTFDVVEGTYTEQCVLTTIAGASSATRITFRAHPANINPAILLWPGSSTSSGAVDLDGASFLTFDGIEIAGGSGSYTRLVYCSGQLSDIRFVNCVFRQQGFGSNNFYKMGVYATTSATFLGEGLTLENCHGISCSYGVYLSGNTSSRSEKFTMKNCTWDNVYYGVYNTYYLNVIVHDNVFNFYSSSSQQYGVRFGGSSSQSVTTKMDVQRNHFNFNTTSTIYGVYFYYQHSSAADPSIVANNFIRNQKTNGTGSRYIFYLYPTANLNIDNNTIYMRDGSKNYSYVVYNRYYSTSGFTPENINFRNNIVVNNNPANNTNGALMYATSSSTGFFNELKNNVYYTNGEASTPFYWGTSHSDYASFASASGDVNSLVMDPQFMSDDDLHSESYLIDNGGVNLTHIVDDIDGDSRPLPAGTNIDIGADEFIPPTCPRPIDFTFKRHDTTSAIFEWNSINASEWQVAYGPVGFTPMDSTSNDTLLSSNPDTVTGLAPFQFYHVYIRSVCSAGDSSRWTGPIFMHTYDQGEYLDYEYTCGPGFLNIDTTMHLFIPYYGEFGTTLPFPILYQGEPVEKLTIGLNGGIILGTTTGQVSNSINNSSPNEQGWFPFCMRMDDGMGGVHYKVLGQAPNRYLVMQWDSVPAFPGGSTSDPGTFQVYYEERTTNFYFNYQDVEFNVSSATNGGDAEIGVRGLKRSVDISMNNTNFLSEHSCIKWFYTDCPNPTDLILLYLQSEEAGFQWTGSYAGETSWDVKYGPEGFDPATVSAITVSNPMIQLPSLLERTTYEIIVYANCDNGFQSEGVRMTFTTPPHCNNPDLFAGATAVDSLITSWVWTPSNQNPAYDLINYELTYGDYGFDPQTGGTVFQDDDVVDAITPDGSLLPGGVYDVYVRAKCQLNFKSDYVGPISLVMPVTNEDPCDAVTIPVDNEIRYFHNGGTSSNAAEASIAPPVTGLNSVNGWGENTLEHTTWFSFIAPASGQVRISMNDQDFDGQLAVYANNDCSNIHGMQLQGANDNDMVGASVAPNFTLCGLTPGEEYYMMHDSYNPSETGIYSFRIYEIFFEAGVSDPKLDICHGDEVNLFSGISGYTPGGTWIDLVGTGEVYNDSIFKSQNVAYQNYAFEHRFEDGCAMDSTVFEIEVHAPSYAGADAGLVVCKNEPFNLYHSLESMVDHDGVWTNSANTVIPEGDVKALTLFVSGTYKYTYIVSNGICPPDTMKVLVTLNMECDYLGMEENLAGEFKVYPNPVNNVLHLEALSGQQVQAITVLDAKGREVLVVDEIQNGSTTKIPTGNLSNGVYMLRVKSNNAEVVTRFVKN